MGGGNNAGMRVASGRYFLLLNSDAWVLGDAVERLAAFADAHPDAAVVGPRLRKPGRGARSARCGAFRPLWRLATEYFFLRKLAPRVERPEPALRRRLRPRRASARPTGSRAPACSFAARRPRRSVSSTSASSSSARRRTGATGSASAGWKVVFCPGAEVVHVGGATHGGRAVPGEPARPPALLREALTGLGEAERARRLLLVALRLRGAALPGRARAGRTARRLAGSRLGALSALLESPR